jgi:mRNA interferase MazF
MASTTNKLPRRGSIWYFAPDPIVGSEQGRTRPCVVVQRDSANATSPTTIACPLTSAHGQKPNLLTVRVRPPEGGLDKESLILCKQVRVLDRRRMRGEMVGELSERTMALVDEALRVILDLGDE